MTTPTNQVPPLVVERTFQAPIAQVWHAITDADAMRVWYFDLPEFKAEPGFEFRFVVEHEGHTYDHRCRVTEAIPLEKLAYTWRYDGHEGESLVTIELFEEGAETRLKLTHEGLETFPKSPAFGRENFERGWTQIIGSSLKEYLETPSHKLVITREFDAPRDLVWKAWTQPSRVKEWLNMSEDMTIESVTMDLRVGGKFRIQTRDTEGEYFTAAGTYIEVNAPERLVYTWDWEKDGAGEEFGELEGKETQLTVEFREQRDRTELVLTHEKFASIESRDRHIGGWNNWIDRMAKFLEA
ncbi:MAG TPA: SRPBCC domain-containing protein [Chthoniobacterales bacterium]|nr:SRPBCC domain-containing protein [Chthoniobacterales bacterium]